MRCVRLSVDTRVWVWPHLIIPLPRERDRCAFHVSRHDGNKNRNSKSVMVVASTAKGQRGKRCGCRQARILWSISHNWDSSQTFLESFIFLLEIKELCSIEFGLLLARELPPCRLQGISHLLCLATLRFQLLPALLLFPEPPDLFARELAPDLANARSTVPAPGKPEARSGKKTDGSVTPNQNHFSYSLRCSLSNHLRAWSFSMNNTTGSKVHR